MKTDRHITNRANVDAILITKMWLLLFRLQLSGVQHASQSATAGGGSSGIGCRLPATDTPPITSLVDNKQGVTLNCQQ